MVWNRSQSRVVQKFFRAEAVLEGKLSGEGRAVFGNQPASPTRVRLYFRAGCFQFALDLVIGKHRPDLRGRAPLAPRARNITPHNHQTNTQLNNRPICTSHPARLASSNWTTLLGFGATS